MVGRADLWLHVVVDDDDDGDDDLLLMIRKPYTSHTQVIRKSYIGKPLENLLNSIKSYEILLKAGGLPR